MRRALFLCAALAAIEPGFAATAEDGVIATLGKRLFPVVSSMERSQATATVRSMLARLLMAMKAPMERDALILSDPRHIDYVASAEFAKRNQNELGYQPGKVGKRTSPFDVAFLPSPDSSRVDPLDPLDP